MLYKRGSSEVDIGGQVGAFHPPHGFIMHPRWELTRNAILVLTAPFPHLQDEMMLRISGSSSPTSSRSLLGDLTEPTRCTSNQAPISSPHCHLLQTLFGECGKMNKAMHPREKTELLCAGTEMLVYSRCPPTFPHLPCV